MTEANLFDDDDWDPEDREQAAEMFRLDRQLDREQAALDGALQRIADDDPVGMTWFGSAADRADEATEDLAAMVTEVGGEVWMGHDVEAANAWLEKRLDPEATRQPPDTG